VSKKRPRTSNLLSKQVPAYWRKCLFKNTYTYQGRQVQVRGWSVKIQHLATRKTFSLMAKHPARAAEEACEIYQTILAHGWEAAAKRRYSAGLRFGLADPSMLPGSITSDLDYWRRRLVHRKYPEQPDSQSGREFCVRIEHAGTSYYFPLQTSDQTTAAERAMRIHQTVVRKGWARANEVFSRELSLALRWQDHPVAWTYTTIHTGKDNRPFGAGGDPSNPRPEFSVVVIEPDEGIRGALAACANSQQGFRCEATFAGVAEALAEISRRSVDLVLANHDLPSMPGAVAWEEFEHARPGLPAIFYSVFEDSDQLFIATPGGAIVYLLKRTAPARILEPIADLASPVNREQIVTHVRDYFQRFAASLPSSPPSRDLAKLTPREHEILALLSKGDLVKEIADTLGISFWTVQGHIKSTFEKLNVHSRIEAVLRFLQK
jgi:DNA-binding NarL/FixJ family response regulator